MAIRLTFDDLMAAPDLARRYREYIPRLKNRAQWRPDFDGCRIKMPDTPLQAAIVEVFIVENLDMGNHPHRHLFPRERWIHLHYAVTPSGSTSCVTATTYGWAGAESAYKQPVDEWVDAIRNRLEEDAAKERTQARARAIHEELVAAVWAPTRVAALLDQGGWDLVDAVS